ncbi:MAG: thylakoid membrane photosystem I accumulation factor [Stenomitos frigidus ULC029]
MRVLQLYWSELSIAEVSIVDRGRRMVQRVLWLCLTLVVGLGLLGTPSALAGLTDDRYDGEIFTLYAGNGSLVPPKFSLAEALRRDRPALLYFYVDDSKDCKAYTAVISQLQAFYGKAADLLPIRVDAIPSKPTYTNTEPGYYYTGVVPQVVLFDASGKVVLNENGVVPFETIDAKLRELFDLLPRSESTVLKRRQVNEVTTELAK